MVGLMPEEASASSASADGGGIFSAGLDAYRTVTDDEYRSLLTSGLIVLDANVLLSLYRYHANTRPVLIQVLAGLKDRLWVPYQAMLEFHEGRTSVIASRSQDADQAISDIGKNRTELERGIRTWTNRVGLLQENAEQLIDTIRSAITPVVEQIREQGSDDAFKDAQDTAEDLVITSLEPILEGNVGSPLSPDELREALKEARQRNIDKRPPGWKDASKRDNPEGDYLVWRQTLIEAKRRAVDVLFVTGDVKDDWWRKERGEIKGPLPELALEMRTFAGVRLFMLRPGSLLIHAGKVLGIEITSETVRDAEHITVTRRVAWNTLAMEPQLDGGIERLVDAMRQLGRWYRGKDTYNTLVGPVANIEAAARGDDEQTLLDAVWTAVQEASARGWFSGPDPWYPDNWEEEVWAALDFLYINAVQAWLETAADRHLQINSDNPTAPFAPGALPPGVADTESHLRERSPLGDTPTPYIEFISIIVDSRRVVAHRAVTPKLET